MSSSSILSVSENVLSLLLLAPLAVAAGLAVLLSSSSSSHVVSASFPSVDVPGYFFRYSERDLRIKNRLAGQGACMTRLFWGGNLLIFDHK